jgi:hypothetical protein
MSKPAATPSKKPAAQARWPRRQWRALVKKGDWASALEIARRTGFEARELTLRPSAELFGEPPQPMEELWFANCPDESALVKLIALAKDNPSPDTAGKAKPIPSRRALQAALAAGNEAGVSALKKTCRKLFAENVRRLTADAVRQAWGSKEWAKAESSPELKERLLFIERSLPAGAFSAQKAIKTLGHGGWPAMVHGEGRAGIARLALREGLDPMAIGDWGARIETAEGRWGGEAESSAAEQAGQEACDPTSRAPLAILALGCEEPDVFMEFVRAGADPRALRLDWHDGVAAGCLSGVMGVDWDGFRWPAALDDTPRRARAGKAGKGVKAAQPLAPGDDETRLKSGLSAQRILEAAFDAKLTGVGVKMLAGNLVDGGAPARIARWRAAWEAWALEREADSATAARTLARGPAEAGDARRTKKGAPRV